MALMYLIALIPVIIGAALWVFSKKIVWFEWLIGCGIAFAVSGIIHAVTIYGMTYDKEIWSGQVQSVEHEPYWHATWTEIETYTVTVGSGENMRTETRTRLVTKTHTHHPEWNVHTSIGNFSIDQTKYNELKERFGEEKSRKGHRRSGFDRGDPYDYFLVNKNNWVEPVTDMRSWENRVKAAPSVFSFPKVPEDKHVHEYPSVGNRFRSDRLFGRANGINLLEFDRMCARLGSSKKVNIIIIGFPENSDSSIAQFQEAAWIGGKKNDLVLCYGGGQGTEATWSYVFGWTEEELVKRNLESILIESPINSSILPLIEKEVRANYIIKDWEKFEYLSIEPPTSAYIWLLVVMSVTQIALWVFFHVNDASKDSIKKKKKLYPWTLR